MERVFEQSSVEMSGLTAVRRYIHLSNTVKSKICVREQIIKKLEWKTDAK